MNSHFVPPQLCLERALPRETLKKHVNLARDAVKHKVDVRYKVALAALLPRDKEKARAHDIHATRDPRPTESSLNAHDSFCAPSPPSDLCFTVVDGCSSYLLPEGGIHTKFPRPRCNPKQTTTRKHPARLCICLSSRNFIARTSHNHLSLMRHGAHKQHEPNCSVIAIRFRNTDIQHIGPGKS